MLGGNMEMGMTNNITRKPTVFVSSTCYDLNSVRKEIKDFFEQQLGYETILSEYMEFPISPERDTFENCVDNVDTKADIFILIVGTRYGHVMEDKKKSITNIEYLHAKAKGIPIYIFIHKSIIETLPKWENEPNTDFSGIVDNTSLFEFVQQIRSEDNKWTFEFECVENIVESLRVQIANLLSDSLVLRMHKYENGISKKVMSYFGEVFEMAVEKPRLWEFRLFAAVLKENMKRTEDLQLDLKYGISFEKVYIVKDLKESVEWILAKVFELKNYISMIEPLINDALTMALGVPGESGMEQAGLERSMAKKGCSPDNSACEGLFGRLKNEMFYNRDWTGVSIQESIDILNEYLIWYNEKRIKISLGNMIPREYRQSLGLAA